MSIIKEITRYIRKNKQELLITTLVFSNLFQQWIPSWVYFIGLLLLFIKYLKVNPRNHPMGGVYRAFIVLLWFSSIIGFVLDLRLLLFTIVLLVAMPYNSLPWHYYKLKLLRNFYIGFAVVTLLNFYAKLIGYNYLSIFQDEYTMNKQFEFSGFGRFAMWTSCAAAISTMVFTSYVFRNTHKKLIIKCFCYGMILVSLYVTIISASRSAFFLAIATSLLTIKLQTKRNGALMRNLLLLAVGAFLFAPVLIDSSEAMLRKKNGLKITTKNTSRDALWGERMEEFQSSPIWGIGFAAHGVGENKRVGRNESGGSFISVLAQTGLIGFVLVLIIWAKATNMPRQLPDDPNVILTYGAFVFMSIHCIIEGYMFQAGWYLCLIIWLVVGVMIENKTYKKNKWIK